MVSPAQSTRAHQHQASDKTVCGPAEDEAMYWEVELSASSCSSRKMPHGSISMEWGMPLKHSTGGVCLFPKLLREDGRWHL